MNDNDDDIDRQGPLPPNHAGSDTGKFQNIGKAIPANLRQTARHTAARPHRRCARRMRSRARPPITPLAGALLLAVLLSACAPRVDGSTPHAAKASIERMKERLSPQERERLEEAMRILVIDALSEALEGGYGDPSATERADARLLASLDGHTARDLIARADALSGPGAEEPES